MKAATKTYWLLKYLFWGGCLPGNCLIICLLIFEKGFLENHYLFGSQKKCFSKVGICLAAKKGAPEKLVSVWWKDIPSWKIDICSVFSEHILSLLENSRTKWCSWKKRTDIFAKSSWWLFLNKAIII